MVMICSRFSTQGESFAQRIGRFPVKCFSFLRLTYLWTRWWESLCSPLMVLVEWLCAWWRLEMWQDTIIWGVMMKVKGLTNRWNTMFSYLRKLLGLKDTKAQYVEWPTRLAKWQLCSKFSNIFLMLRLYVSYLLMMCEARGAHIYITW